MGLLSKRPTTTLDDLTRQVRFNEVKRAQIEAPRTVLPAEWSPQSAIQLTWPHKNTDWRSILKEAEKCYLRMAYEIAIRQPLLIVSAFPEELKALLHQQLPERAVANITLFECDTNDTWARDHGFITILCEDGPRLLDFCFNGWGLKFEAEKDNLINGMLAKCRIFSGEYVNHLDFVLEGGAIESDGQGTILTTSACMLSAQRNPHYNKQEIEEQIKHYFQASRILWLDHGYLAGDDTDSHIDTLARFCPHDTIVYVKCYDTADEHYEALCLMEEQLKDFRTADDRPYRLLPLPLPDAIYNLNEEGTNERLPATYANFLIMNEAVLMPTYNQPHHDEAAKKIIQQAFPNHEIVPINCTVLIKQHGSLHCCTMQFPAGVYCQNNTK